MADSQLALVKSGLRRWLSSLIIFIADHLVRRRYNDGDDKNALNTVTLPSRKISCYRIVQSHANLR